MKKVIFLLLLLSSVMLFAQTNTPWSEDFEGGTFPPTGWTKEIPDASNDITQSNSQNHTAGGQYSARFSSYDSSSDYNQYLFSMQTHVVAGNDELHFWHRKYNTSNELLEWGISTTTATSGAVSTWTAVTLSNTDWQETVVDLSAYDGQDIYVAFHYYGNYLYYVYLDDVSIQAPPACPAPSDQAEVPGVTSADLSWTAHGTATAWNIEWGPTGFTQGSGTTIAVTTNPYTLNGLTANTTYDWYVQSDCGGGSTSSWIGPSTFTTHCASITSFPWTEDFSTWPPDCWDLTGGSANWQQYAASDSSVYCAEAHFWGQSEGTTDVMTTPILDVSSLTTPVVAFDWSHQYNSSYPNDSLSVWVSDDNGATWTKIWGKGHADLDSQDGAGSTSPGSFVNSGFLDLSSYGNSILIKFYGYSGWGPDLFVDNVTVKEAPTCPDPTSLSTSGITTTQADLDWTQAGSPANWSVEYGPTGFTQGSGTTVSVSAHPYTLTGLSENTHYDWYVKANCGLNGSSAWVGPNTFTTKCNPINTFPYSEGFSTWPPDCWDLTGGSANWAQYSSGGVDCAKANFWGQPSGNNDVMTATFDVSSLTTPSLMFDWSHSYSSSYPNDSLIVWVSDDNGANWTNVWGKGQERLDSQDGAGNTAPGSFVSSGVIDLSSFGSNIMIKFEGISGYGPDLFIDNVQVKDQLQHDVSVKSQSINQVCNAGAFAPQAIVQNLGSNTETFDVTMNINGRWSSTKTVTSLASFTETTVTFDSWTPTAGTSYDIQVYTALSTDEDTSNDTLNASTLALNLDKTVYAHDAQGGNVVSFNMKDPGTFTTLSAASCTDFYAAMTFVDTLMKAFEYGGNGNKNIWTIQKDGTQAVDTTYTANDLTGIAYNPNTRSTVYAASGDSLYTIDLATGVCTAVGAFGTGGVMIGIAYDQSHNILYGVDLGTDKLYTINTSTGAATEVGPLGIDLNYAQDCAFDQENGYLMLAGYSSTGALYYIDTTTGAAAKVGDFENGHELTGFAIPYPMTVASPTNVTINISGGNANLSWDAVSGASSYNIYGATDPYGTFTLIQGGVTGTTWSEAVSGAMKFYHVTAATARTYHHTHVDVVPAVKNTPKIFRYDSNNLFKK